MPRTRVQIQALEERKTMRERLLQRVEDKVACGKMTKVTATAFRKRIERALRVVQIAKLDALLEKFDGTRICTIEQYKAIF